MSISKFTKILFLFSILLFSLSTISAQPPENSDEKDKKKQENKVRVMTIPITIFSKQELKEQKTEEFIEAGSITVKEDNEEQNILSIRSVSNNPLSIGILIQDNLSSSFNLELKKIAEFIRRLPEGSRVMVAYLRGGNIQIRQKFTDDLDKAANSLRIVTSSSAFAPNSPYEGVREALERFKGLPSGRRAMLLISDGLDASNPSPTQSLDLERAILQAQRNSVAVYSFYSTTNFTETGGNFLSLQAQGSLSRLAEETGGRAFFQGSLSPISFEPFFKDLNNALNRQFALTYLSTHMKKGFHKVQVLSSNPEVKIEHPKSYVYR
jgi:VWFA-related protein